MAQRPKIQEGHPRRQIHMRRRADGPPGTAGTEPTGRSTILMMRRLDTGYGPTAGRRVRRRRCCRIRRTPRPGTGTIQGGGVRPESAARRRGGGPPGGEHPGGQGCHRSSVCDRELVSLSCVTCRMDGQTLVSDFHRDDDDVVTTADETARRLIRRSEEHKTEEEHQPRPEGEQVLNITWQIYLQYSSIFI